MTSPTPLDPRLGTGAETSRWRLAEDLGRRGELGLAAGHLAHVLAADLCAEPGFEAAETSIPHPRELGLALGSGPSARPVDGGGLRLDGEGPLALCPPGTRRILLLCRGHGSSRERVLLPVEAAGLVIEPLELVGLEETGLVRTRFESCPVTARRRLGPAGERLGTVVWEARRLATAALLALLRRAMGDTLAFTVGRPYGDGTLSDLQAVRHQLADLAAELGLVRALAETTDAADGELRSEQALALALELAPRLLERCLQLHGGRGYMTSHPLLAPWETTRTLALLPLVAEARPGESVESEDADESTSLFPDSQFRSFRQTLRELAADVIAPNLETWEREETLPRSLFRACAAAGLTGVLVPKELGGTGLDITYSVVMAEELVRAGALGAAVSLLLPSGSVCPILAHHGSDEIHERFLRPILRGEKIAALGITEPGGGSAVIEALTTTAEDRGDCWSVRGEKIYITNGPIADLVLVLARTAPGRKALSMTLLAVPTDTPGFRVCEQHQKLGLRSSPTGRLAFEDCRIPKSFTVGEPNQGYMLFSQVIQEERLLVAASAVAIAAGCLHRTERAALAPRQREALPRLRAELAACRAYVRQAATGVRDGARDPGPCQVAKFAVCDRVQSIVRRCLDAHGLDAARAGTWMDRTRRDVRVLSVFAGTSETVRDSYAAALVREARLEILRRKGKPS